VKTFSFIIAAAGLGERIGGSPKQFRLLGGTPLWQWSFHVAEELLALGKIQEIILVVPSDSITSIKKTLSTLSEKTSFLVVAGGTTRSQSVRNGVAMASSDYVLIHDGARPFVDKELCITIMDHVNPNLGVIPVVPISDALKKIEIVEGEERVSSTSREHLYTTQTPQCFPRLQLLEALDTDKDLLFKDEAEAWIALGKKIVTIPGARRNMKITYQEDFILAHQIASNNREYRVGNGFDIHPLVPSRPLILGGVEIESPLGLDGHSDADVLAHAVMDALLGAAGLPDIGKLFPASDPQYKNISSLDLLSRVASLLKEGRWDILWVDVTLQAQLPRLGSFTKQMEENLGKRLFAFEMESEKINIKVKSGERIGAVGRAECMKCTAVATLSRWRR